jgi:acetyl esterase/lipase
MTFDANAIAARLDADIRAALAATPFVPVNASNLHAVRTSRYSLISAGDLSGNVDRRTVFVPGPPGAPDVALRIHRPVGVVGPLPCLYWMHGGGLVLGSADQDDFRFDRWCHRHQIMAVSVEYRLAPEHHYPAAIEDCYVGLRWVADHAEELGVDAASLGIGGASAGGGLAAALALLMRDRGGPRIQSQLLIYPMLDDRQTTPSSRWEVPIWPPSSNSFGWSSYLGEAHRGPDVSAHAAPARAVDLAGLPPALITVGAVDGFVDEDIAYAQRLNQAGVDVELHVYPGAPHGFDGLLPATAVARRCLADTHAWIAKHYAHG